MLGSWTYAFVNLAANVRIQLFGEGCSKHAACAKAPDQPKARMGDFEGVENSYSSVEFEQDGFQRHNPSFQDKTL